ncbi:hypothetical protein U14_04656 [Candidatus Moduliflexus flocculans]|uniref:Uncharacterized protein n=1 Tax=Candidatus Moduliflexus flocculans TaxID=1499966 RepID=A0A0S6W4K5_9BACT|nr:hypothetical protein U14_04656 [Candidatus Moduliflexus flocculans]
MGSSVSDCSCQEPTPNPSPEGSVRSFVSNRLRNMSQSLLRWYQKYGHYWQVEGYQKVQYGRVKPHLKSIVPQQVSSFTIGTKDSTLSERQANREFVTDKEMMTAFFQTIPDMRFAAPIYKEFLAQWKTEIHIGTKIVTVECSIPADDPTLVISLIDSPAGYTYFQSRQLYQWYQTYSHRWLTPEGTPPAPQP